MLQGVIDRLDICRGELHDREASSITSLRGGVMILMVLWGRGVKNQNWVVIHECVFDKYDCLQIVVIHIRKYIYFKHRNYV